MVANELGDFSTAEACGVDVVTLGFSFVIVSLAMDVHEIEFIDQAMPLEQLESPVNRTAIDRRVEAPRLAQDLRGIEMTRCRLDHLQDRLPLLGQPNSAL